MGLVLRICITEETNTLSVQIKISVVIHDNLMESFIILFIITSNFHFRHRNQKRVVNTLNAMYIIKSHSLVNFYLEFIF